MLWRQTLSNQARVIRRPDRRGTDHTLRMKILRQTNVLKGCSGTFACKGLAWVRARALTCSPAPCPTQSGLRSFTHLSRIFRASLFTGSNLFARRCPPQSGSNVLALRCLPRKAFCGADPTQPGHQSSPVRMVTAPRDRGMPWRSSDRTRENPARIHVPDSHHLLDHFP